MKEKPVRELIAEVAREQFPDVVLERIDIERDEDADGDPILRVLLVLSATDKIEPRKFSGFLRHFFDRYADDEPFPLLTFRSASDDRRTRPEAA